MLLAKFIKVKGINQEEHSISIDSIALVSESADGDQTAFIYLKQSVDGSNILIHALDSYDEIMNAIDEVKRTDVFSQQ